MTAVLAPETTQVDTAEVARLLLVTLQRRGVEVSADVNKLYRFLADVARSLDHLGVDHRDDEPGAGEWLAAVAAAERLRRRQPGQRRAQAAADRDAAWIRAEVASSC